MTTRSGFTLIELLIVILIITFLTGLVVIGGGWLITQSRWLVSGQRLDEVVESIQRKRGESPGGAEDFVKQGLGLDIRFLPIANLLSDLRNQEKYGPTAGTPLSLVEDTIQAFNAKSTPIASTSIPPFIRVDRDALRIGIEMFGSYLFHTGADFGIGVNVKDDRLAITNEVAPTREVLAGKIRPSSYWYYAAWPIQWPVPAWDQPDPPSVSPHVGKACLFAHTENEGTGIAQYQPIPRGLTITGSPFGKKQIRAYPKFNGGEHSIQFTLAQTDLSSLVITRDIGAMEDPEPCDLSGFSPLVTTRLLRYADILSDGTEDYRTVRRTDRPWNDRWGNPLVLSASIFIPPRHLGLRVFNPPSAVADPFLGSGSVWPLYAFGSGAGYQWVLQHLIRRRDMLLHAYHEAYTYNRSVTISGGAVGSERVWVKSSEPAIANYQGSQPLTWSVVGDVGVDSDTGTHSSIGPEIPVPLTDRKILRALWLQVLDTTQARRWNQASAENNPPWRGGSFRGIARLAGRQSECLVLTPVEIK